MYELRTENGTIEIGGFVFATMPGHDQPEEFRFLGTHFNQVGELTATIQGSLREPDKNVLIEELYPTKKDAMIANVKEKAKHELKEIQMWYTFGYDSEYNDLGNLETVPSVGIRANQDVNILGTMWMLSGDACDKDGHRIVNINQLSKMNPDELTVKVRAQGMIDGDIVQFPVGEFKCIENKWADNQRLQSGRGFLSLTI